MNKMKEVAELLGVQLGEEFEVSGETGKYKITEDGLMFWWCDDWVKSLIVFNFLFEKGIQKSILNKQEKEYLEQVLRPFKDKVINITKYESTEAFEFIGVYTDDRDYMNFPNFKIGSMYKGMETDKRYTLKELGLFDNE